jgi:hypothetical protein
MSAGDAGAVQYPVSRQSPGRSVWKRNMNGKSAPMRLATIDQ